MFWFLAEKVRFVIERDVQHGSLSAPNTVHDSYTLNLSRIHATTEYRSDIFPSSECT